MNKKDIIFILNQLKIRPQKHLGQNFLVDDNTLNKMLSLSEITRDDVILEIGPGLGFITEKLVERAKKVYAIEIESRFCTYLDNKFSDVHNIEIINDDILRIDLPFHNKIVSNIPYTITGPILEKIFYKKKPPVGIMIIERAIAQRIFYDRRYKNLSRITISSNSFLKPIEKYDISHNSFYPVPKIELSLVKLIPKENFNKFLLENDKREFFLRFIAGIMPYKNKKIANALLHFFDTIPSVQIEKDKILQILKDNNFPNDKLFRLRLEDFVILSKIFFNNFH
jgi:16S rRNA (adenine1518-N6/adenine1519-N6)-dimethyltransferase